MSSLQADVIEARIKEKKFMRNVVLISIGVILALITIFAVGCPQYRVYKQEKQGEANLRQAESDKLIQLEEAKANLESERLNAQAEVVRAEGAAEAIDVEAGELTKDYIQYLWVRQQNNNASTVYIPTEAGLPILEAGRRP